MTPFVPPPFIINRDATLPHVLPHQLDHLLAAGWRHFGTQFFRYNVSRLGGQWHNILAVRTLLDAWQPSKSQRRILRKNTDLRRVIQPVALDPAKHALFERHKIRFDEYIPHDLYNFLSEEPATIPCPCLEISAYLGDELLAISFLDVGQTAVSSVYAMFDPAHHGRSLGLLTMLWEIDWARAHGKTHYYSGYTTIAPSHYDYKKRFHALETYDFTPAGWQPFPRQT